MKEEDTKEPNGQQEREKKGTTPAETASAQDTGKETRNTNKGGNTPKSIPDYLVPYVKAYPNEKAFHVTSDKQVFLEKALSMARLHQNSLKNGEKVQTIKVK